MVIGVSTAMLYPRDTNEYLNIVARCGITRIEVMIQDLSECSGGFGADLARRAVDKGIWIEAIHYPLILSGFFHNPYPAAVCTARTISRGVVECSVCAGARRIVAHSCPSGLGLPGFREASIQNLRYLRDLASGHGVVVALENVRSTITASPTEFGQMAGQEGLAMTVDVTECGESGYDPAEFILAVGCPEHVHLSDYAPGKVHLPLGQGLIDWESTFRALQQVGYEGMLSLEISWRHALYDAEDVITRSIAFIKEKCAGLQIES